MSDEELIAGRIATIHGLVEAAFPGRPVKHFRHKKSFRFLVTDPGQPKILDVTDTFLAINKAVINIDDVLSKDRIVEIIRRASNQQRVVCSSSGIYIDDDVN